MERKEARGVGLAIVRRHLACLRADRRQDRLDDHRGDIVERDRRRETRRCMLKLCAAKDRSFGIVQQEGALQRLPAHTPQSPREFDVTVAETVCRREAEAKDNQTDGTREQGHVQ